MEYLATCDDHCILVVTLSSSLVLGVFLIAATLWGKRKYLFKDWDDKYKNQSTGGDTDKYLSELEDYK